jgi:tetratricopeptide (TPR) repeat protein
MLGIRDKQKRCVIPKWLSLDDIVKRRDIAVPRLKPFVLDSFTHSKMEEDYREFKNNPNPLVASDLMGSAFVVGEHRIATEVASYVKQAGSLPNPTIELANKILNVQTANNRPVTDIHIKISQLKRKLSFSPKNPLLWVELARLYTIKGQLEKAKRAITTALALAPSNRYVIRSAARFYIHCDDLESAWHYAKRALALCYDPWIDATLINIGLMLEKSPPKVSKNIPLELPTAMLFPYSELFETRALLEMETGNDRKAKKLFRTAWSDPSENVVTHGEWVLRNLLSSLRDTVKLNLSPSPEAEAWEHYWMQNLDLSMNAIRDWGLQEPYSRHPWILGSSVACHSRKFKEAAELAKQGLLANPKDFLLHNNLAFALLKNGKHKDAEEVFRSSPEPDTGSELAVNMATRGLLEYKKNNLVNGRHLYLEAIDECDRIKDMRLKSIAYLNLAIAEIEADGDRALEFVKAGFKGTQRLVDPTIICLTKELEEVILSKRTLWSRLIGSHKGLQKQQVTELLRVVDEVTDEQSRLSTTEK